MIQVAAYTATGSNVMPSSFLLVRKSSGRTMLSHHAESGGRGSSASQAQTRAGTIQMKIWSRRVKSTKVRVHPTTNSSHPRMDSARTCAGAAPFEKSLIATITPRQLNVPHSAKAFLPTVVLR
jgi:hypothetical protein